MKVGLFEVFLVTALSSLFSIGGGNGPAAVIQDRWVGTGALDPGLFAWALALGYLSPGPKAGFLAGVGYYVHGVTGAVAAIVGITPLLSMVHELQARQADFQLIYCARFPENTAFLDQLATPALADKVHVHHSHGDPARSFAIEPLLANHVEGTHLYCCGPRRLMQAVRAASKHWPAGTVHLEDFGSSEDPKAAGDRAFAVHLAHSKITVGVPADVSILEALRSRGVPAPSSCESGTCGSCRTRLLAGKADHRDYVLDDEEHDTDIMICVSRAERDCELLVLDL